MRQVRRSPVAIHAGQVRRPAELICSYACEVECAAARDARPQTISVLGRRAGGLFSQRSPVIRTWR
jgi:hypothetical protein